jgi:hypothetical protein
MNGHIDWTQFIDDFGRAVLADLGIDLYWDGLPHDYNPVTRALRNDPGFISRIEGIEGFYRKTLARLATVCQTVVFDAQRGPERDNKPKMIRRHWYVWFKTQFAQPFAEQLGDYELSGGVHIYNDLKWAKLLSTTLAWFVDEGQVTYQDLWVKDDSRMVAQLNGELFLNANIILAVEKDSLFADMKPIAQSLGARAIISGKGKNSKAAIEKVLRDFYGWRAPYEKEYDWDGNLIPTKVVFSNEKPLVILHLSDYDFDGEAVIGPTFAEQARRYTNHILEARIGITPRNVGEEDLGEVVYQVKVSNKGYVKWAEEKAVFLATCQNCGTEQLVIGTDQSSNWCANCFGSFEPIEIGQDPALGLEVEALPINAYRPLLAQALLEVVDFWHIVQKLREETLADAWSAGEQIKSLVLDNNPSYQGLVEELQRYEKLEALRLEFEEKVLQEFYNLGTDMQDLYWWQGEDPEVNDFVNHVTIDNGDFAGPWRPFSSYARTKLLVEDMEDTFDTHIVNLQNEDLEWEDIED